MPSSKNTQPAAPSGPSAPRIENDIEVPSGAGVNTGAGSSREKTQAEIEADKLYEEAMEEEYAKREGGA